MWPPKSVPKKCRKKVKKKKCPQKVSTKSVHNKCPKKCPQTISTKSVHKKWEQKVSTKSVTIRTRREIQCFPYAGFVNLYFLNMATKSFLLFYNSIKY